ncbi:MAG TPA: thioesterase family protein [Chitinophagaceae bacterium]|jgi:Predicted thioesterase
MARVKIDLPATFNFTTKIPIRITDINYGGHLGNDTVLSIIHEARVQFLKNAGYEELNLDGTALIMSDAAIEFKNEAFYGDVIIISVAATSFSKVAFELYYKLERDDNEKRITVAVAKTGMVCYDYQQKKIIAIPASVKENLAG